MHDVRVMRGLLLLWGCPAWVWLLHKHCLALPQTWLHQQQPETSCSCSSSSKGCYELQPLI